LKEDVKLKPIGKFATEESLKEYPEISVREHTIK
jgi:hypothetical protein